MTSRLKKYLVVLFMTLLSLKLLASPTELQLRIMETTDVHTNIMNYDYYKGEDLETVGLIRTSRLGKNARSELKNTVLVDN
jgi:2',3'-cyclic-nucleotide 2'-phosphodiesterase (5'-nucleotidase family)